MEREELIAQLPEDNTNVSALAEQIAALINTAYGGEEE